MTREKKGSQGKVRELSTVFGEEVGGGDLLTPESRKKDTPSCYNFIYTYETEIYTFKSYKELLTNKLGTGLIIVVWSATLSLYTFRPVIYIMTGSRNTSVICGL